MLLMAYSSQEATSPSIAPKPPCSQPVLSALPQKGKMLMVLYSPQGPQTILDSSVQQMVLCFPLIGLQP